MADGRARARAWRDAAHDAVCDVVEPWAHGTVVRATRYPGSYEFNAVRVEDEQRPFARNRPPLQAASGLVIGARPLRSATPACRARHRPGTVVVRARAESEPIDFRATKIP